MQTSSNPLRLEWIDPSELRSNPANWRTHPAQQVGALKAGIAECGWAGALLYNERTGNLIDGHARKELFEGKGEVPVLIGSWDDATEKKILATLDPIAAMAEASKDKLDALLREVQTGDEALAKMLGDLATDAGILDGLGGEAEAPDAELDRAAELQAKWGTASGQLWLVPSKSGEGEHRVLCGDSTKAEDVGRLLGGRKPFIMVTDPPYGVEYDADWRDEFNTWGSAATKSDVENDDIVDWTDAYRHSPAHVAYVWHAGVFAADLVVNLRDAGYQIRTQVIWRKPTLIMGRGHYHWQHEPCWYAVRKGGSAKWCGDRKQSTMWDIQGMHAIGRSEEREPHPTQKPVECMARPIRNHGGKGDDVYDPFLGSGTTICAAESLGRIAYGIEISPAYVAVILERLTAMGLQPRLETQ